MRESLRGAERVIAAGGAKMYGRDGNVGEEEEPKSDVMRPNADSRAVHQSRLRKLMTLRLARRCYLRHARGWLLAGAECGVAHQVGLPESAAAALLSFEQQCRVDVLQ
ncbi:hypothetical protein E2C01_092001 [Portunus trituberculatus]|uniref:Uncharacterized protein n=1 Tax=Portunus trituberculatus TaxID=210409 RepID=A0A5B7JQ71_PORTR|nr:hypothetical protein [Portunus trituberculatus]